MIFDLHNDLFTSNLSEKERLNYSLNVTETVIYAFWTTELKNPAYEIEQGIQKYLSSEKIFSVEDIGFAADKDIDLICLLKPFYCGLTHNKDNKYAGGSMENGVFTNLGKQAVTSFNRAGIAIDTAHLGRDCFYNVAEHALRLINSHTGLDAFHSHPRNLTDAQVRLILQRGGIIGLTAVSDFIGGDTVNDYIHLIDTFIQKYGIDGVSIGTDFYGTKPLKGLLDYNDFNFVEYELEKYGYSHCDIRKIFYDNANNYFKYRRLNSNDT